MKKKSLIVFSAFLLILILLPFISSVPPTQTNVNIENGLQIFFPAFDFAKQDQGFSLHVHVANLSNGFPLFNTDIDCFLHLYNSSGKHTYQNGLAKDSNGFDHGVFIEAGNFSDLGLHAFYMWCNDSTIGGEARGVFEVTPTGVEFTQAESNSYLVIVISLIAFLIASLYGFITLPYKNTRNEEGDLVSINDLKYAKILLGFATYGFFTWLANIMISLSSNYLHIGVSLGFFTMVFKTMLFLMWPLVVLTIIVMGWNFMRDFKFQEILGRGLTPK